jgi:lipopolysaccharide transport system permease protein
LTGGKADNYTVCCISQKAAPPERAAGIARTGKIQIMTVEQLQTTADETGFGQKSTCEFDLPEKPVVVIEADRPWAALNLRDLWRYRELLYFLIWRDIRVRYKQTVLGAAWAVLQPLVTMIIFAFFFGKLAKVPTDGIPFPAFYYSGLLLWTFFSNSVTNAANSLTGNVNLVTKVYFPRLLIPSAAVGAALIDFAIASVLLIGLLVFYGYQPIWLYLMLIPLVVLTTFFALGLGIWLAALNVKYRDIRYALPFVIQTWFFLSPVIYPSSLIPEEWRWVLALNPLTGVIEGFRAALFGREFYWGELAYSSIAAVAFLFFSAVAFRRMESSFAEVI